MRSARKRIFLTQPCCKSTSTKAMTVRVFPGNRWPSPTEPSGGSGTVPTGGFDCPLLVVPSRYFWVYLDIPETCPHSTQVKKLLQIPLGVKSCYPPLRINTIVNPGIKPIGEEDHRTPAIFLLQNIRVQFSLLTPSWPGPHRCALPQSPPEGDGNHHKAHSRHSPLHSCFWALPGVPPRSASSFPGSSLHR